MSSAGLDVFRDPTSVTVVGASADPAKWGWWLAEGAVRGAHRREVHLVNRRRGEVAGRTAFGSLAEVPGALDLVALCVPAAAVHDVVAESLERGARGFLGITAGIDHASPGAEQRLAALVREAGARMVGPNCLGLYDAATDLQLAWGHFRPGRLAIVSQSGQVGSELANLAAERGLGVSRFVSLGNQVDVTAADVLVDLVDHEPTAVVALYLEGFGDGPAVLDAIRRLAEAGTPTLLIAVGASDASRAAAVSHTGGLTSDLDVVDAACRAAGAVRVATPQQLVDAAYLLARASRSRGRRVGIVGDSGGQGALAADVLSAAGLVVPALSATARDGVATLLPAGAGTGNPVDLAGVGEADLGRYADVVEQLVADEGIDSVLLTGYFGSYAAATPSLKAHEEAAALRIAATARSKPVVVHSMATGAGVLDLLDEHGVPSFHTVDAASQALAAETVLAPPVLPGRTPPPDGVVPGAGYLAAREWLAPAGVPFPQAVAVSSREEVREAASRLRAPYVLKADWIAHKTEHAAVRVGLGDLGSLLAAYDEMAGRLGPGTYVVEEQDVRPDVVELIVGARRDPVFGPLLLVGAGGTVAELVRDTAVELAPLTHGTAHTLLARLGVHPLLTGWRGRPPVDVEALEHLLVVLSERIAAASHEVLEVELNPVRVGPDGVLAVDALVVTAG